MRGKIRGCRFPRPELQAQPVFPVRKAVDDANPSLRYANPRPPPTPRILLVANFTATPINHGYFRQKRKPLLLRREEAFPNVIQERPTYNGRLAVNPPQYLHNSRPTPQCTAQQAILAHLPPWDPRMGALGKPPLPLRLRATRTPVHPSRHPCRRQTSAYYRRHRQSSRRCYSGRALRRCPEVQRWMCCEICFTRRVARGENDCSFGRPPQRWKLCCCWCCW